MFIKIMLALCVLAGGFLRGYSDESKDYHVLCTNVVAALGNGKRLTSPAFTNQMHAYRSDVDIRVRSLAELALSDALLTMCDELSDFEAYEEGCRSCSNVLFSAELPVRSWQKSVASLFYAWALRMDGKMEEALAVCRTALSTHLASPTMDVERAVWSAMSRETGLLEMNITNALKLAAALSVPAERRPVEWNTYTNGLPPQAMRLLREELDGLGDGVLVVREACRTNSLSTWEGQFAICEVAPLMIDDLYVCTFTNANCEGTLVEMYLYHSNELSRVFQSARDIKGVTPVVLQVGVVGNSLTPMIWMLWRHPGNGGSRRYELYEYTNLTIRALATCEQVEMDGGRGWFSIDKDGEPVARTNLDFSANRLLWTNQRTRYSGNN